MLQDRVSSGNPAQSSPPLEGGGLLQFLVRIWIPIWIPNLHEPVQAEKLDQESHPPFTEKCSK
jgi:hypothetical protein